MSISYKKLWHILLDRDLHKKDLIELAGISEYAVKRLSKNENVSTEVLHRLFLLLMEQVEIISRS